MLRTLLALCLLLGATSPRAHPLPDPLTFFAQCTGRLSAEMEFHWLMDDPRARDAELRRASLAEILEALTPRDAGPEVLHRRITAKAAHSRLLHQAAFSPDARLARHAEVTAARFVADCTRLLLG